MRFIVLVKANEQSEAGVMPTTEELTEMGAYNEQLVKAGIMLAGEGLQRSAQGVRVKFSGAGKPTLTDGPFAETKELVAGFWIWQVRSRDEALEWIKRAPFRGAEVELRQIAEADEFGDAYTEELRERDEALRRSL